MTFARDSGRLDVGFANSMPKSDPDKLLVARQRVELAASKG
jgi:hypothetical protein